MVTCGKMLFESFGEEMKNFLLEILKFILGIILTIIKWFLSLFTTDNKTNLVREEKHISKKELEKEKNFKSTVVISPNTCNTKLFTIAKEDVKEILEVVLKNEKVVFIRDKKELISKVNKEITKKCQEEVIKNKDDVKKEITKLIKKEILQKRVETLKETDLEPSLKEENLPVKENDELVFNEEKESFTISKEENSKQIEEAVKINLRGQEEKEIQVLESEAIKPVVEVIDDYEKSDLEEELTFIPNVFNDDTLFNKDYEKIDVYTEKKIENLTYEIKNKPLLKEEVIQKEKEIKKLQNTKKEIEFLKEEELETIRKDIEYEVTIREKEMVLDELSSIKKNNDEKIKSLELDEKIPKINAYLDNYKEYLIRQEISHTLNKLTTPLIFAFPFIKNKYFRLFTGSVFLYNSFHFMRSLLGGPRNMNNPLDLTAIRTGMDALNSYGDYLKINLNSFYKLKEEISLKYPHLMNDEEFVKEINKIEKILNAKEQKYLKDKEKLNKYFYKGKYMERKLKRKIV